jgi:hypothetical protein
MPEKAWPTLPFVIQDGIPLSVCQGYILSGMPERAESYLAYCRSNGVFRAAPFSRVTRQSASHALHQLYDSTAWKRLKWKDGGVDWSYDLSEEYTKELLQMQVEHISFYNNVEIRTIRLSQRVHVIIEGDVMVPGEHEMQRSCDEEDLRHASGGWSPSRTKEETGMVFYLDRIADGVTNREQMHFWDAYHRVQRSYLLENGDRIVVKRVIF